LLLVAVWPRIDAPKTPLPPYLKTLALLGLILTFVQVALGTQVREAVDSYLETDTPVAREAVIDLVGVLFLVHRSYSLTILALNAYIGLQLRRAGLLGSIQGRWHLAGWGILLLTIPTGMVLAYLGLPHWAQPLHLTAGSLLAAQQFMQYRAFRAIPEAQSTSEKLPLLPA
jgi:cytochrome c oxidase assembly protein subunit 15